jgi:hypothetical protein
MVNKPMPSGEAVELRKKKFKRKRRKRGKKKRKRTKTDVMPGTYVPVRQ